MMLKSPTPAQLLPPVAASRLFAMTPSIVVGCISMLMLASGCRQAGAPANGTGMAPINGLPGQAPMGGPAMPALGPFGASARVPPPATGSYGSAPSQAFGGTNAMPANYAPPNIAPMTYNDAGNASSVALAGGFASPQAIGPGGGATVNSQWHETNANPGAAYHPNMDLSRDATDSVRSGGMQVNDLTGAPAPPGYSAPLGGDHPTGTAGQPSYAPPSYAPPPNHSSAPGLAPQPYQQPQPQSEQVPATSLRPMPGANANSWAPHETTPPAPPVNQPSTSGAISGGGYVDSSPAANQPSMSTADRPVQWQTPRR